VVTAYPDCVKEFVVYTALRILLFLASLAVVIGVWMLLADRVPLTWAVVIAFVVSGLGSYFLLNPQRAAFARRVEERASRATARFEEMKSREDQD
jgi:ABC-type bacteriocin/lantibiotic exporter with double-glycine peptidase domain